MRRPRVAVVAGALLLVTAACGTESSEPESAVSQPTLATTTSEPASPSAAESSLCTLVDGPSCAFDHDNFDNPTVIDNEWLPMSPGTRLVYQGFTNEFEILEHRVVITVTDLTKVIDGIETVVSWDLDFEEGDLVEAELAFFAQDNDGNVWRMGEHPEEYENGRLVDAPTWLAGIRGAKAGISMLGAPVLGTLSYSQGWSAEVEFLDRGRVLQLGQETCVAFDCYSDVLVIDEFNVEEPGAHQLKYFASGVGNVRVGWSGNDETREELELVSVEQLNRAELAEVREAAFELEAHAYEISPDVYGLTEPAVRSR